MSKFTNRKNNSIILILYKKVFGVIKIKKHLFLTGYSGCGKTTMLKKALGDSLSFAGGFITQRIEDEGGELQGFEMLPAAAAGGVEGFEGHRFLDYTVEPPKTDNEVFRNEGVRLLEEAQFYPFSLIDEFGGFEMVIPQFRNALQDFLNSDQPIIGVLKGFDNAQELRAHLGLGEKYSMYFMALREALMSDPDTEILEVEGWDDENAMRTVMAWAEEYGHA